MLLRVRRFREQQQKPTRKVRGIEDVVVEVLFHQYAGHPLALDTLVISQRAHHLEEEEEEQCSAPMTILAQDDHALHATIMTQHSLATRTSDHEHLERREPVRDRQALY